MIFIKQALTNIEVKNNFAFTYINGDVDSNILGLLADFFLSIIEINFIFIANIGEKAFFYCVQKTVKLLLMLGLKKIFGILHFLVGMILLLVVSFFHLLSRNHYLNYSKACSLNISFFSTFY